MTREIKYIEVEKILRILDVVHNARDRLMIKLFFATFCRCNELRNIRISDIKFNRDMIHIRADTTKTKIERMVVIPKQLKDEIIRLLKKEKRYDTLSTDYLFKSREGQLTNRRIRQLFQEYSVKAEIQEVYNTSKDGRKLFAVTPHTLRHSGIIEALNKGIPQTVIMEQSGHKSLQSFQIYSKFSVKDRQRIFKEKNYYELK